MLDGDNPTGGETAAITCAIHLIDHRNRGITGADEIGMERMAEPVFNSPVGGRKRLGDHLTAENPLLRLAAITAAAKEINLQALDIEKPDQISRRAGHSLAPCTSAFSSEREG